MEIGDNVRKIAHILREGILKITHFVNHPFEINSFRQYINTCLDWER